MIDAGRLSQACTQGEIDEAFSSAKKAQKLWAKTPL
jgi:acyl-CoA reductase-like NAD-dependent aldehyde dehydrogenase